MYQGERWQKDKDLYTAIQVANWDDLVLAPEFKENLERDMAQFFNSEPIYQSLGITWKRGIRKSAIKQLASPRLLTASGGC